MPQEDGINVTEMLIDIKTDISKLSTKLDALDSTTTKADKALEMATQNENELKNLRNLYMKAVEIIGGGVVVSLVVFMVEQLLG